MGREYITREEGKPYQSAREGEQRRDVFTAELDYGGSVVRWGDPESDDMPYVVEPVYTIMGSGESKGGPFYGEGNWTWGIGTNLRVSRSSIPALMRVLADLLEHEPEA